MIEQLIMRAGDNLFQDRCILGTVAFATHNVYYEYPGHVIHERQAFACLLLPQGQSLAKRPDMAQNHSRYTRRVGMVVFILALSFILFGKFIVSLYTVICMLFLRPKYNAGGFDSALPIIPVYSGRCIEGGRWRATAIIMF